MCPAAFICVHSDGGSVRARHPESHPRYQKQHRMHASRLRTGSGASPRPSTGPSRRRPLRHLGGQPSDDRQGLQRLQYSGRSAAVVQHVLPVYGDISRLNADNDGIACEALRDEAPSDESVAVEAVADGAIASNPDRWADHHVAGRWARRRPSTGAAAVVLNVTVHRQRCRLRASRAHACRSRARST